MIETRQEYANTTIARKGKGCRTGRSPKERQDSKILNTMLFCKYNHELSRLCSKCSSYITSQRNSHQVALFEEFFARDLKAILNHISSRRVWASWRAASTKYRKWTGPFLTHANRSDPSHVWRATQRLQLQLEVRNAILELAILTSYLWDSQIWHQKTFRRVT